MDFKHLSLEKMNCVRRRSNEAPTKASCWPLFLLGLALTACSNEDPQLSKPSEEFTAVFRVAPGGDDANPGTLERPFATLDRARVAVREINVQPGGDILVEVAPGDYFFRETFILSPEDSGTPGRRVIYRGGGEPGSARLIGVCRITQWEPVRGNVFRAVTEPGHEFNTLYENGFRARKARFPNFQFDERFPVSGARYLKAEEGTDTRLTWREGDLRGIEPASLTDRANLIFWPGGYAAWHKITKRIGRVDAARRAIFIPGNKGDMAMGKQARFYIEGARSLLDEPGEFYLDPSENALYYWPRFGNPNEQEIIAPTLKRIVSLEGRSSEVPVRNLVIEGFTLAFSDTFDALTSKSAFTWSWNSDGAQGVVHLRYTEDIGILFNHIQGSGMNGIYLERSNKRDRLYGNWIEDCGISGIVLADHREAKEFPQDINENNIIENNRIHLLGSIAVDSAGINLWGARGNIIRHCEIFDGARYGISIRGNFAQVASAEKDRDMPDTNRHITGDNRVEFSHLYRLGQDSGDMGAIHLAGISSKTVHPVNTFEQILIEDVIPHPSMKDVKPNGIFFDYPRGVTDQVLRDIEIRTTETPFRVNNTDIRHTYDNVSWKEGFDPTRLQYDKIGLESDFPENFRRPREVSNVTVREEVSAAGRKLNVAWTNPNDAALRRVHITVEGEPAERSVTVKMDESKAVVIRPSTNRLAMLRIQTEDNYGNRSPGILVPAAERPAPAEEPTAAGINGGIALAWQISEQPAEGFQITTNDPKVPAVNVKAEAREVRLTGLQDAKAYDIRVDAIDRDGHPWPGPEIRATAGLSVPVPEDAAAWWTFDETEIRAASSIGDASGHGNTLFVGNDQVGLVEGKFGKALRFDGKAAYVQVLAPKPLAIGAGDFAVSLWVRPASTVKMTQRVFEFGGTGEPGLSIMTNNTDVRTLFTAGEKRYGPYYRGLELPGRWTHIVVNIQRDRDLAIYVDGEKLATEDISAARSVDIPAASYLHLGRFKDGVDTEYNWSGDIDQVRIYHRALDAAEIAALYEEGKAVSHESQEKPLGLSDPE